MYGILLGGWKSCARHDRSIDYGTPIAYTWSVYSNSVHTVMEFIEAPAFTRHLSDYLDDEGYREMQMQLAANPELGDLMPGTGGFRKARWVDARRGKGRRGGLRIVYYYFKSEDQIWLMTLYDKNEAADLTAKEKKALKAAIEGELAARATRRSIGPRRMR